MQLTYCDLLRQQGTRCCSCRSQDFTDVYIVAKSVLWPILDEFKEARQYMEAEAKLRAEAMVIFHMDVCSDSKEQHPRASPTRVGMGEMDDSRLPLALKDLQVLDMVMKPDSENVEKILMEVVTSAQKAMKMYRERPRTPFTQYFADNLDVKFDNPKAKESMATEMGPKQVPVQVSDADRTAVSVIGCPATQTVI